MTAGHAGGWGGWAPLMAHERQGIPAGEEQHEEEGDSSEHVVLCIRSGKKLANCSLDSIAETPEESATAEKPGERDAEFSARGEGFFADGAHLVSKSQASS